MASAMDMVCNTLGIDRVNMNNKMILIEEQHGSNGNFLINAILSNALKRCDAICLALCHNTFGHYHNIGMRLGYNLSALKEKGQVTIVEPMAIVRDNIVDMHKGSMDKQKAIIADVTLETHTDVAHRLFTCVREKYEEAAKSNKSVLLIIDDMSHLLDCGLNACDVMYFVRYLRSFMTFHPMSQLCILAHTYVGDPHISDADMIANNLRYMAHLSVRTEPLQTGYSRDVSGKLTICWRINSIRSKFHWAEKSTYLFKLSDWQVKIYAPGTAPVLP